MTTKETALAKITELVARFEDQYDFYKKADYNETFTRRDFIDPFFKALGWDVDNENGYAQSYREVIHEDKLKIGRATKAPDYSFRLVGGKRLFFVEAKKPSVVVKDEIPPAYQVRRYGWSAKLPVSIITDFEEFSIYDCTKKPKSTDKASVARIKYLTWKDYLNEFDFLWETFSKERVLKGSFDKFVEGKANKKGTTTVDKDFLQTLDNWRTYLATSISWKNKDLDEDEINFAVQQTIDRIIFLRIAEDRGVEPENNLKYCIKGGNYYQNLYELFKIADDKYNSGLFDFTKDKISLSLVIDNKVIKNIIEELYYPKCEYEFSVLPVEILGTAYEQFLGKVIRITPAHHAKIEEKPEVRKAGGVYYTPQYIVDYIVKNTVGKLVEDKTPVEVSDLRIVDPACGSGSFLLGAYQFLLDWHKDYYTEHGKPSKGKKDNPLTPDGHLTTAEKKRILLNNIYGVDIDVNAVEVTKLSLLLKCMEGETEASIASQFTLFNERILPTLDDNIKNGNSLIDTDIYDNQLDFGEEKNIKPFNWQNAFPGVFNRSLKEKPEDDLKLITQKAKKHANLALQYVSQLEDKLSAVNDSAAIYYSGSGFDAVIGNPPYVMLQNLNIREVFNYALINYKSAKYKIDTYQLFIEQSINLLKSGGFLGVITPNTFLKNIHSQPLRKFILDCTVIDEILLFNYSVFSSASVDTCITLFRKEIARPESRVMVFIAEVEFDPVKKSEIYQTKFNLSPLNDFDLFIQSEDEDILSKITSLSIPLKNFCDAYFGIQTFDRKKYVSSEKLSMTHYPIIDGANIERYSLKPATEYVNFNPSSIKSGGKEAVYRKDRICLRQIGKFPIATYVPKDIFTLNTIYNVFLKDETCGNLKFILGLMNSNIVKYYWRKNNSDEKKTFPKIKKDAILTMPIPLINTENQEMHKDVIKYVEQLLLLNLEKTQVKLDSRVVQINSKIDYCENRINQIIYNLYGLTEDEIKIVEGK